MNNKRCNNPPRALSLTVAVGAASIRSQGGIWFQTVVGSPVAFRARSGLPHRLRLQKKRGFILQFTISNLQCLTFSFLEEIQKEKLADFCRRNGIRRLAFFGSVLREDFTPDSDVDVLKDHRSWHWLLQPIS